MIILENGLMELAYDASQDLLSVKWPEDLRVESALFHQTILALLQVIEERKIKNLIIDSGIPMGGVLTEEIIHYITQHIPYTPLQKIALLESPDYLWDDNLYQVLNLLITTYRLPILITLVENQAAALAWFKAN